MSKQLQTAIDAAWEARDGINSATKGEVRDAVEAAIAGLDNGTFRTAEKCRRRVGREPVAEEGRAALLPPL